MRKFILGIILFGVLVSAQTSFEPIESPIYKYLERAASQGYIHLDDIIKPYSRNYILDKLNQLEKNKEQLSPLEQQELNFYIDDYYLEVNSKAKISSQRGITEVENKINILPYDEEIKYGAYSGFLKDPFNRYRLYTYKNDLFKFAVDPVIGFSFGSRDSESHTWYRGGISLFGYIGKNFGFNFMFYDNTEKGNKIDRTKSFSPERGIILSRQKPDKVEYSEIRTNLTYSWNWGSVSIGKDFLNWGYGKSGQLVLSDKAPSFPYIRLDIKPADWISFNYMHAWLKSDVLDSNSTYPTYWADQNRILDEPKYLATHTVNLFPFEGFSVSLGESVIYSDRLELAYLTPLMFFRLADHFLSDNNNNKGANSQFFFNVSSRNHVPNTHLYASLFIDEIRLSELFNSQEQKNQVGFTLGASTTNLPVNNIDFAIEYTKIYPYVYQHYIPTQPYSSDGYGLGHWVGHNSDILYTSLQYRIIRGLTAKGWLQYIRKGGEGDVENQYSVPQPPFLFGLRNNYTNFGFDLTYQLTHNLFIEFNYSSWQQEIEVSPSSFEKSDYNEFHFSINYGLR